MSSKTQDMIATAQELLITTYAVQPIALESGKGCYVTDTDGKRYLDFAAGIAVASLGHAHETMVKVIREQAEKLIVAPPSYTTAPKVDCARIIVENSCFDQVFFTNSGTEAVEACLKTARKWAHDNKGPACNEIISFRKSFHGRSYGAASLTEKRHVQPYFAPYLPGIHFADFNDIESVKKFVSANTAAIFIEPVQGEGGINPATPEFMKALRSLCDENRIVLVFDEIQTGWGRTGKLFAYEHMGVEPDIAAFAKGMGGGFPIGAMAAKKPYSQVLTVGSHGSTYAGNPLATAVSAAVMSEIVKPAFISHVQKTAAHLVTRLQEVQRRTNQISSIRGLGLLLGVDVTVDIKKLLRGLQGNGLLATQAGDATLRLTPPLIVSDKEVDESVAILEKTLKELS